MADDAATIVDIVVACRRIGRFMAGADEAAFQIDEQKHWAVVSQLLLIGEACGYPKPFAMIARRSRGGRSPACATA